MYQLPLLSPNELFGPVEIESRIVQPMLWAERFVLLSHPDPKKELRNITLQPGLNIIRTERRLPGERRCVAHDVGKTLFMRLLRYTLGDPCFGDRVTINRVREAHPFGMAIAQWHLADAHWTVVRPFDEQWQSGYVIRSFDWSDSLDDPAGREPLDVFLRAIDAQLLDKLPPLHLTSGEPVGFTEILPWLARDTQFGFQKPDAWRDKDVNHVTPLAPKTNRLLMKWLMGLVSPAEANSRNRKHLAKAASKVASSDHEKAAMRLSALHESLKTASQFTEPEQVEGSKELSIEELAEELIQFVREQQSHYRDGLTKCNSGEVQALADAETECRKLRGEKETAVRAEEGSKAKLQGLNETLKAEKRITKGPTGCPAKETCAWRQEIEENAEAGQSIDPQKLAERLDAQISETTSELGKHTANLQAMSERLESLEQSVKKLRAELDEQLSGLRSGLAKWDQLAQMGKSLVDAVKAVSDAKHQAEMAEDDVRWHDQVVDNEEESKASLPDKLRLEHCYTHTLSRILDDVIRGQLDAIGGLRPSQNADAIRHGTALTTIESVLAYDLSCVLASMCGQGQHPRLLLHDGPREGEAESELFRNLLATAQWMESLCEKGDESFQYIVTTADAPDEFSTEHPAVAGSLHGRDEEGRLLRKKF